MNEQRAHLRNRRNKLGDGTGPLGVSRAVSERRRRLVDAFLETGDARRAAVKAGYSPKSASQEASRLLKIPNVADMIRERQIADSNTKIRIMTRQERQQMWSQMARAEGDFTG